MRILVYICLCLVMGGSFAVAEENTIGRIKTLTGAVEILRGADTLTVSLGDPLQQGDTVMSGEDSSVGMTFKDNTVMSMGPKSKMTLDEFVYDPMEIGRAHV